MFGESRILKNIDPIKTAVKHLILQKIKCYLRTLRQRPATLWVIEQVVVTHCTLNAMVTCTHGTKSTYLFLFCGRVSYITRASLTALMNELPSLIDVHRDNDITITVDIYFRKLKVYETYGLIWSLYRQRRSSSGGINVIQN